MNSNINFLQGCPCLQSMLPFSLGRTWFLLHAQPIILSNTPSNLVHAI